MKKVYLIVAHKYPGQLYRLIDRLSDEFSHFFIHIDKKVDLREFDSLRNFNEKLTFINRYDGRWGKWGVIQPLIESLRYIHESEIDFDRLILLSGQDYPIKSNKEINDFFQSSPYSVFINFFSIPNFDKWPGKDRGGLFRVDKYYFGNKPFERLASKTTNFLGYFLPFIRRQVPGKMLPYAGSAWVILDDYALKYILKYLDQNPAYFDFHRYTFVTDEVFIQMLIGNTNDQQLISRTENSEKHFIVWPTEQSAHPKILDTSDFNNIKASPHLFARKFDEQINSEILDLIDEKILRKF